MSDHASPAIHVWPDGSTSHDPEHDAGLEQRLAASDDWLAQFFVFAHLRPELRAVSRRFAELAAVVLELPRNPERTVALRKLLEAKDCAVRAALAG